MTRFHAVKGRPAVSRRADAGARTAVPAIARQVLEDPGQALDTAIRVGMESRFGHDFSRVRVHADRTAADAASALGADAYTVGQHVVFGAGGYAPGTDKGSRLLIHELTHVMQQRPLVGGADEIGLGAAGDACEHEADRAAKSPFGAIERPRVGSTAPLVQRSVTASGIQEARPRFSYSTHCGWIDWGHARPDMAQRLIRDVRAASATLRSAQSGRSHQPGHHVVRRDEPGVGVFETCPTRYEPGERIGSRNATGPLTEEASFANHKETYLYGFEVDQTDPQHFVGAVAAVAAELTRDPKAQAEIYGYSDCIGSESANLNLRAGRALAVLALFPESVRSRIGVATFASSSQYLATNQTVEGRRRNRSVAIKLLPPLSPANVFATQSSGAFGVTVNAANVTARILKPLTPDEELRVALAIFMAVSTAFEQTQSSTDFIAGSSFSEEDLPSNLIGFYVAANNLAFRGDVEQICDSWSPSRSLSQFRGYTFGKTQFTFKQLRLPAGGVWPTQFDTIQPEPPGPLWRLGPMTLIAPGSVQNIP